MKDLWKNGIIVLLVIGVLYILYLRECKREDCPPEGQVLVPQPTWDSIKALADMQPIVTRETIKIKGDVIYLPGSPLPNPEPEPKDSSVNKYADSLVRKGINVHYNFKVRGTLVERTWSYIPMETIVRVDCVRFVPKIVPMEVPTPQNGFYLYGMVGGNLDSFVPGGGIDYITKKGTELGYLYQRVGKDNFHSVKLGIKITFKK